MQSQSPADVQLIIYTGLDQLPYFRPEEVEENTADAVRQFRRTLMEADGVVICTPEYAGSMPGVLKNALEWTVSSGEFYNKPVAAISASPSSGGGERALESLVTTLSMLDADIAGKLAIPYISKKLNIHKQLTDADALQEVQRMLNALIQSIRKSKL